MKYRYYIVGDYSEDIVGTNDGEQAKRYAETHVVLDSQEGRILPENPDDDSADVEAAMELPNA